jgi:hypothetical protein
VATKFIHIRVDEKVKQTIEEAARRQGKTVTTFVLDCAVRAANQVPKEQRPSKGRFRGVPSYFRGCCLEASRGGELNYSHPGYHLAIHLSSQIPWDADLSTWPTELHKLRELLETKEDKPIWHWFMEHFPNCMGLVPRRRWQQFVRGVRLAHEEGRI